MLEEMIEKMSSVKATILGGIFLAISFVFMLLEIDFPVDFAYVTIFICGIPLVYWAMRSLIFGHRITSALLVSIAMAAAIFIGEIFAAGEVAFIMALGSVLEEFTIERAKKGVNMLASLVPTSGWLIRSGNDGETVDKIGVDEIRVADKLRIFPGETIPVDGEIVSGRTSIDQSTITGESLPVDKSIGDSVFCGTINRYGSIDISATKVGKDSSLQKMITMVKTAESEKTPIQRIVDKWASWLVPIAILIAIFAYIFTQDITRAVTVLVVFCPCALFLATPTSIVAAIGQATKHGVLIKSGEALEKIGKIKTFIFDKTGTLTFGILSVSEILPDDISSEELLQITASLESRSEHPLGKAVVAFAKNSKLETLQTENFEMIPGKGVTGKIATGKIICGNEKFIVENRIEISEKTKNDLRVAQASGKAVIVVANSTKCLGIITFSDVVRTAAAETVAQLKASNSTTILLTGDHSETAKYFAEQIGISDVKSDLLPEEKVAEIKRIQNQGKEICMVGDGINDAPALKTADIGIAMGGQGSRITVDAADITLVNDDLLQIPYLQRLSNSTISTIKFNISLSMLINCVAITLSILGFLNPVSGALVHNAGSILVVLNAALLYDRKI